MVLSSSHGRALEAEEEAEDEAEAAEGTEAAADEADEGAGASSRSFLLRFWRSEPLKVARDGDVDGKVERDEDGDVVWKEVDEGDARDEGDNKGEGDVGEASKGKGVGDDNLQSLNAAHVLAGGDASSGTRQTWLTESDSAHSRGLRLRGR